MAGSLANQTPSKEAFRELQQLQTKVSLAGEGRSLFTSELQRALFSSAQRRRLLSIACPLSPFCHILWSQWKKRGLLVTSVGEDAVQPQVLDIPTTPCPLTPYPCYPTHCLLYNQAPSALLSQGSCVSAASSCLEGLPDMPQPHQIYVEGS